MKTNLLLAALAALTLTSLHGMESSVKTISEAKQKELNESLFSACSGDSVEVVKVLLDQGAQLTALDEDEHTPLHWAAEQGSLEISRFLIARGANLVAKSKYDMVPLHTPAFRGNIEICTLLLDSGTPVNSTACIGATPLLMLAINGNIDVCMLFIEKGADLHRANDAGETPLSIAAGKGRTGFCKVLLGASMLKPATRAEEVAPLRERLKTARLCLKGLGVPKDVRSIILESHPDLVRDWSTIFYYGLCKGHLLTDREMTVLKSTIPLYTFEMLKTLMEVARGSARTYELKALIDPEALEESFGEVITTNVENKLLLLQQKARWMDGLRKSVGGPHETNLLRAALPVLTLTSLHGMEPSAKTISEARQKELNESLFRACNGDSVEAVEALLDQGAQLTALDVDENTPLHCAAGRGRLEISRFLIARGASVLAKNRLGMVPLHAPAGRGDVQLCALLLDNGAQVNSSGDEGTTPLQVAAVYGYVDVGMLFIEREADVHRANDTGMTPLRFATVGGRTDFCRMILVASMLKPVIRAEEVAPLRKSLKTARLCLVKLAVPRGVRNIILESHPDLVRDWSTILYYDLCRGHLLTSYEMAVLKRPIPLYTFEMLKPLMEVACGNARTVELKVLLDPEALEENFGKAITTNIENKLLLLQQKARWMDGLRKSVGGPRED